MATKQKVPKRELLKLPDDFEGNMRALLATPPAPPGTAGSRKAIPLTSLVEGVAVLNAHPAIEEGQEAVRKKLRMLRVLLSRRP